MNKNKIKVLKWIFVNLKKCNLLFNLLISYISFCVLPQIQIYLSQLHKIFLEIAAIPNPTSTKPSPQISMMPLITQLSNCHELWPIYTDPPKPSILRNHNFIHQFFFWLNSTLLLDMLCAWSYLQWCGTLFLMNKRFIY